MRHSGTSTSRSVRRRARQCSILIAGSLLVAATACEAPAPASPPSEGMAVRLPSIPLPKAKSFTVSPEAIDALGCAECDKPGSPDAARFFYGSLPLASVDEQIAGTATDVSSSIGNLFASGYFGGIYLRGNLQGAGATDADLSPFAPLLDQIGAGTTAGIDSIVGQLLKISRTGSDADVKNASTLWSAILAAIAGYNRGYLEVALENPPAGATAPTDTFSCASLFDCRSTTLPMAALDQLKPQRKALLNPTSFDWLAASTVATQIATTTNAAGRDVWTDLLADSDFTPDGYATIIDLSIGFLEVTQAALFANLAGAVGGNPDLARRGLVATASMVAWAGSYFLGLASPLKNSVQPTLTCP